MKINEKHYVRVAFVEIQLWPVKMKIRLFTRVCVCLHVNKVYQINGSMVGRSKLDKNNCHYLHMWVCVYVYEWWTLSMGLCFH